MILINEKEQALVDSTTGNIMRPECFQTLVAYHSYVVSKGHNESAQRMLQEVFNGTKYISKMIENAQKHGIHM